MFLAYNLGLLVDSKTCMFPIIYSFVDALYGADKMIYSHLQGTQLYDPKAGGWRDLGMLDVMQVSELVMILYVSVHSIQVYNAHVFIVFGGRSSDVLEGHSLTKVVKESSSQHMTNWLIT